ncbi:unnamed protein product [Phaeothamnion confervicola]
MTLWIRDHDGGTFNSDDDMGGCEIGDGWQTASGTQTCRDGKNSVRYAVTYVNEPAATPAPEPEDTPAPTPTTAPTPAPDDGGNQQTPQPNSQPTQAPTYGLPNGSGPILSIMTFDPTTCAVSSGLQVTGSGGGTSVMATGVTSYVDGTGACGHGYNAARGPSCGDVSSYSFNFALPPTSGSGGTGSTQFAVSSSQECSASGGGRRLGGAAARRALLQTTTGGGMWTSGSVLCNDGSSFAALVTDSTSPSSYTIVYATKDAATFSAAVDGEPEVKGGFCGLDFTGLMTKVLSIGVTKVVTSYGEAYDTGASGADENSDAGSDSKKGGLSVSSLTSGQNLFIVIGAGIGALLVGSCLVYRVKSKRRRRRDAAAAAAAASRMGGAGTTALQTKQSFRSVTPLNHSPMEPADKEALPTYAGVTAGASRGGSHRAVVPGKGSPTSAARPNGAAAAGYTANQRQQSQQRRQQAEPEDDEEWEESESDDGGDGEGVMVVEYLNSPVNTAPRAAPAAMVAAVTAAAAVAASNGSGATVPAGSPERRMSPRAAPRAAAAAAANMYSTNGGHGDEPFVSNAGSEVLVGGRGSSRGNRAAQNGVSPLETRSNFNSTYDTNNLDTNNFWGDEELSPYVPGMLTPGTMGGRSEVSGSPVQHRKVTAMDRLRAGF